MSGSAKRLNVPLRDCLVEPKVGSSVTFVNSTVMEQRTLKG